MYALCRSFTFSFAGRAEDVGMATGATIHTANGLKVKVARRTPPVAAAPAEQPQQPAEPQTVTA